MNKTEGNAADVAEKSKLQDSRSLDAWWWSGTVLFFPRLGPAWPIRGFSLSLFPFSFLFSSLPLSLLFLFLFFPPTLFASVLFLSSSFSLSFSFHLFPFFLTLSCLSRGSLLSPSLSSLSLPLLRLLLLPRLVSQKLILESSLSWPSSVSSRLCLLLFHHQRPFLSPSMRLVALPASHAHRFAILDSSLLSHGRSRDRHRRL